MAHVACDIFQLLICHWQHLQKLEQSLPKRIIEVCARWFPFDETECGHNLLPSLWCIG